MQKLTFIATMLALTVIVLGSYTRLKDAGLGCPDWPLCYGKIIAPQNPLTAQDNPLTTQDNPNITEATNTSSSSSSPSGVSPAAASPANVSNVSNVESAAANESLQSQTTEILKDKASENLKQLPAERLNAKPYEREKAWIEMIHRYVAGSLGILIFFIAFKILKNYKKYKIINSKISFFLMILVVFQALLGMWTVTLKLFPIIVLLHLLGGLSILALLWLLHLNLAKTHLIVDSSINYVTNNSRLLKLKTLATLTLIFTIIQLALGGWVSANYAALVCSDFPTCQGSILPALNFKTAFNIFNTGIFGADSSTTLDNTARVTIQMCHRFGALVLTIFTIFMCYRAFTTKISSLVAAAVITLLLLLCQIILGISNVIFGLPLATATLHSAVGALLLLSIITVNFLIFTKVQKSLY